MGRTASWPKNWPSALASLNRSRAPEAATVVLRRDESFDVSVVPLVSRSPAGLGLSHPLNANLDGGEDSDNDAGKEDDDLEGRDAPEAVERLRGDNEVSDRVNDDGGQGCIRNVEKDSREKIDGKKDDNAGNDASKRRAHACFRFDGGSRERSSRGVATKEGTEA